jgi:hypothetical protein
MMTRVLILLIGVTLFIGCKDEQGADPGDSKTFIRYFGGEFDDVAVAVEETSDGFLLLSNTEIPTDQLGVLKFKIKLTKTDLNGNVIWQKSYPDFGVNKNVKGSSMLILQEDNQDVGYVVVGDRINSDNSTDLYLLNVNTEGTMISENTISDPTYSLSGNSITQNAEGNYAVLGTLIGNPSDNMFIAELDHTTLNVNWSRNYGAGDATLSNKVFSYLKPTQDINDPDTLFLWSGTVTKFGQTDVRVILAPANSQTTLFDKTIGEADNNEVAADICKVGGSYAITGSSTISGDMDIYFSWITANADTIFTKRFGFAGSNDFGNAVCESGSGAAVILGTIETTDDIGNGDQDYYLVKVDIFGNIIWKRNFGSPEKDEGAAILRTKDGSYLVFGTTVFGGLKKLMLLKVNKNGLLQ